MDDSKRLHREDPQRSGPVRDFSGIYRAGSNPDPAASAASSTGSNGAAGNAGQTSRDEPVGLAYRVIEKHINEGKQNAGLFSGQPYNTRPATDNFRELFELTMRFQSEVLPLWIEALSSAIRVDPSRIPGAPFAPRAAGNGASAQGSRAIAMEIASGRPVQISVDLKEGSERLPLITLGLRAVDPSIPMLSDISFAPETADNPLQLRISISESYPPGAYSGVIVSQTSGEIRGTLTVRIAK
jgi:hypothetical protein